MHVLAADGVFRANGVFIELPPIPEALLEGGFRRAVLDFLVAERAISEEDDQVGIQMRLARKSISTRASRASPVTPMQVRAGRRSGRK